MRILVRNLGIFIIISSYGDSSRAARRLVDGHSVEDSSQTTPPIRIGLQTLAHRSPNTGTLSSKTLTSSPSTATAPNPRTASPLYDAFNTYSFRSAVFYVLNETSLQVLDLSFTSPHLDSCHGLVCLAPITMNL